MPFTLRDSIQTILDAPAVGNRIDAFFPMECIRVVPAALWSHPLEEVGRAVQMPWGAPFDAPALVRAANAAEEVFTSPDVHFIPLWDRASDGYVPEYACNDKSAVSLMVLRRVKARRPLPTVIVCPGGGYTTLAREHEGYTMAKRMEAAGWRAFVLNYRVSPHRWPEPAKDLALAVKYVRANAARYDADPNQLMVMGFSAGGHLCAAYCAWHKEVEGALMADLAKAAPDLYAQYQGIPSRPDMACLCYPVISFGAECHEDSFQALTGGDEALREKLSIERQVSADFPKTFVWACEDDGLVPVSNARRMADALESAGVPHLLKVYPTGGHGCGLGAGTSASTWSDELLTFMA